MFLSQLFLETESIEWQHLLAWLRCRNTPVLFLDRKKVDELHSVGRRGNARLNSCQSLGTSAHFAFDTPSRAAPSYLWPVRRQRALRVRHHPAVLRVGGQRRRQSRAVTLKCCLREPAHFEFIAELAAVLMNCPTLGTSTSLVDYPRHPHRAAQPRASLEGDHELRTVHLCGSATQLQATHARSARESALNSR